MCAKRLLKPLLPQPGGFAEGRVINLRWRDLKLATAKLRVEESKTEAGVREIDIAPDLLHELRALKARVRWDSPSDFVFPGKHRRKPRHRHGTLRLLKRIVESANELLEAEGWNPIPEGVTFHSLRRTYASLMAEAGADPAYTMRQIGHRKSGFTLEVYTDVNTRRDAANERLGVLLGGESSAAPEVPEREETADAAERGR